MYMLLLSAMVPPLPSCIFYTDYCLLCSSSVLAFHLGSDYVDEWLYGHNVIWPNRRLTSHVNHPDGSLHADQACNIQRRVNRLTLGIRVSLHSVQ